MLFLYCLLHDFDFFFWIIQSIQKAGKNET
jgi:hypothetical protein